MAAPIVTFNDHKLETKFHDDYVVHKTSKWELSTRKWAQETWRKEKKIGEGAFGSVWLEKKQEGDQVELRAVKLLPRESFSKNGVSQELLALVKLKDASYLKFKYNHLFVQFFGWYENADQVFLAMEYIEYGDLAQYMLQNPQRTTGVVKEITKQILEGLEVIHRKKICHRDLKPQKILIASPDPIWVKITDFGISKQTKNTVARTLCGTQGYMAPEILGVLPRRLIPREPIIHSLDMWALGSVVYELLASKKPFICAPDENSYIGIEVLEEPMVDMTLLFEYCSGISKFPDEDLQESMMSGDSIAFVRSLLSPDPKVRPNATSALQNPWLVGYTSDWFEGLKKEFSDIGASLSPYIYHKENDIMTRQARKADILQFLPASTIEKVPFLLSEAVARGYHSTIFKLLHSPSRKPISLLTWERLFQTVTETDTINLLLHYQAEIGACINEETVLEWAVRSGYIGAVTQLLENIPYSRNNTGYEGAFVIAAGSGNPNIMKLFLGNRAVTCLLKSDWQVALKAAAQGGYIDIVKLLLDHTTKMNPGTQRLLQAAAQGGYIDIVKLLLDHETNIKPEKQTSLQAAVQGGYIDIVKLLLDHETNINPAMQTSLQAAVQGGYIDIVKLLLDHETNINPGMQISLKAGLRIDRRPSGCDIWHDGALVLAVKHGRRELVELFLATCCTDSRKHKYSVNGFLPAYFMKALVEATITEGQATITESQAIIKLLEDAEPKLVDP